MRYAQCGMYAPAEQKRRERLRLEAGLRKKAAGARVRRGPALDPGPDLNPAEGIWSLLKRPVVNFATAGLDGLVRIIKRKVKKIQYRRRLINGCLAAAGLRTGPW